MTASAFLAQWRCPELSQEVFFSFFAKSHPSSSASFPSPLLSHSVLGMNHGCEVNSSSVQTEFKVSQHRKLNWFLLSQRWSGLMWEGKEQRERLGWSWSQTGCFCHCRCSGRMVGQCLLQLAGVSSWTTGSTERESRHGTAHANGEKPEQPHNPLQQAGVLWKISTFRVLVAIVAVSEIH